MTAPGPGSVRLDELGPGGGYAVWGFRACACGHVYCPVLYFGFKNLFGALGLDALNALLGMARALGADGRRKVCVGAPGCAGVTADELSVAAALAAAQAGDAALRDAHLSWLFAGAPTPAAVRACDRAAWLFAAHRLPIRLPNSYRRADAPPARPSSPPGLCTVH